MQTCCLQMITCVCIYVCLHTYIHTHNICLHTYFVHILGYVHILTHKNVCIYSCIERETDIDMIITCVCIYIYIHTQYVHAWTHSCIDTHTHVCVYLSMYIIDRYLCVGLCASVCVCVFKGLFPRSAPQFYTYVPHFATKMWQYCGIAHMTEWNLAYIVIPKYCQFLCSNVWHICAELPRFWHTLVHCH